MAFLPFRALGVFLASLVLGGLVAWQVNFWVGLLIVIAGVIISMYLAVKDVIDELKDTVALARDPKQIFVASGLMKSKMPFWLKPISFFVFNKLIGRKKPKSDAVKGGAVNRTPPPPDTTPITPVQSAPPAPYSDQDQTPQT